MANLDNSADSPSKDAFAQMLIDAIQKAGEKAAIQYDSEQFKLREDGEKTSVMNLASVYNEYCAADPDKRQTIVKNLVRTWFSHRRETPEDFEDVKPDLLPTVRGRAYFEIAGIRAKIEVSAKAEDGAKFNWPFRPLAESLGIGLVYDLPESMLQLQQHNLDRWKATFDEVLDVACDNLRQITQHKMQSVARGVWRSPWHDNYDPSRMLLPEFVRHHKVTGDPVAMVPNPDTLLLTGSPDPVGLAKLAQLAEEGDKH